MHANKSGLFQKKGVGSGGSNPNNFYPKKTRFSVVATVQLQGNIPIFTLMFPALKLSQNCCIINTDSDFLTYHIYPAWKATFTIWQNMKARKLQKSQCPNCLANWEKIGTRVELNIQKSQLLITSMNYEIQLEQH